MTPVLPQGPLQVEIVIEGFLDPRHSAWFEGMQITPHPDGSTSLTGIVPDQAALYSLISRIRDLGIKLCSINCTEKKGNLK